MRHACIAAVIGLTIACSGGDDPTPLVTLTCNDPGGAQCGVYTVPADWPVDVRASCESSGGTFGAPCPAGGRVGTCTCTGSGGISTVVHYYDALWTVEQASASCTRVGCAWSVP